MKKDIIAIVLLLFFLIMPAFTGFIKSESGALIFCACWVCVLLAGAYFSLPSKREVATTKPVFEFTRK